MNINQRTILDTYGCGDYAGVRILEEVEDSGDSLFEFLLKELSDEEGCDSVDLAIDRLRIVIDDVQNIIDELDKI